jgi:hypothetical protein
MCSYGLLNDVPTCESQWLLGEVFRGDLGGEDKVCECTLSLLLEPAQCIV